MVNQLFICGALFLASFHGIHSLKICSFNVRTFGKSKAAKEGILDVLVKIISRCDLLLMMEIKDSSNQAFPALMRRLNNHGNRNEYTYIISERLGMNTYKEQYAFIYRSKLLSVKRSYQYPNSLPDNEDVFAREPFVVWFSSRHTCVRDVLSRVHYGLQLFTFLRIRIAIPDRVATTVKDFVIIPLHSMPDSSACEIDALYDVYTAMRRHWKAKYFILMGDFNADCGYVRRKDWKNIRLRNNTNFVWLIGDDIDTTVKESTHCAYDRIVIRGGKLLKAVVPNSAKIFNFKEVYGMTERQALNVSDHFPVEVDLQESHGFYSWLKSLKGLKG